jgi:UDP:flavonoid glycosyltransferase YjiC (YdhE family)
MRLTIVTAGSRGDAQPYVALALGLRAAGHQVLLAGDPEFEGLAAKHGLEFASLPINGRAAFSECPEQLNNPASMLRWLKAHYTPDRAYFETLLEAMRGSDAALIAFLAFPAAHVAEALDIPWIGAFLQPWTPSRDFSWALPGRLPRWIPDNIRGEINWWSSRSASVLTLRAMRDAVDDGRHTVLGLPPVKAEAYAAFASADTPAIYGYSPLLVPEQSAWTPNQRVTGFWFLPENGWQPPARLARFLDAGEKPVVVGFGSMGDCGARAMTALVVEALRQTGQRGILLGGWAGLGESEKLPDTVLRLDEAPHEWLLPRAAAILHHGGAGTTAAALRAGIPSIIAPFFGDQPFWGERVSALGVGPAPVRRKRLTVARISHALDAALSPEMRAAAAAIGAQIRAEDGVGQAVVAVQELLRQPQFTA